jgi:hypothetical protein
MAFFVEYVCVEHVLLTLWYIISKVLNLHSRIQLNGIYFISRNNITCTAIHI